VYLGRCDFATIGFVLTCLRVLVYRPHSNDRFARGRNLLVTLVEMLIMPAVSAANDRAQRLQRRKKRADRIKVDFRAPSPRKDADLIVHS